MCWKLLLSVGLLLSVLSQPVSAVTEEDFLVKTTEDLIDLCTVSESDELDEEAIHFCHGYLVGAYHYYKASTAGPDAEPLVCPPEPPPSREAVVSMFIEWAKAHPQYMNELPVETEFRFLTETWPCK
ncbi:Rap1a/Tai family immunity protein [Desulfocurvibacter africanus]|uniref:Rap1a/Tai family immunity protein n=1 Tax=Desulfocurvibacter africanus TaxID=873 RepID=UPI00041CDADA|nr:Rap1a/Tai family immunity protein [Desulfocurvibacter africanus]